MRISVFTPTYNAARFLTAALDSVLAQEWDDLEIVISDDASTDGTQEVAREYAARHPKLFRVSCNSVNLGVTANCNKALALCTGDLICFFAGDDLMLPGKLRAQANVFAQSPDVVLCYHDLELFDSETDAKLAHYYGIRRRPRTGGLRDLIRHGNFIAGPSVMARRNALPPGGFDSRFLVGSDHKLWLDTLESGGKVAYLNQVLTRYRRHNNNLTNPASLHHRHLLDDALAVYAWAMAHHPEYLADGLHGLGVTLRAFRKLPGHYRRALWNSLKLAPSPVTLSALLIDLLTLGRVRL